MTDLQQLLAGFVAEFGSQTALGKAIGVSASRLSRVMSGEEHSLEVLNCLKLADVTGRSPSVVLRAAGKGDVADLIEKLYGKARPAGEPAIPPIDREHLEKWQRLRKQSPYRVRIIENALDEFLGEPVAEERPPRKRKTA